MERVREGFGVALGGGTARALAHVGALQALAERGYEPCAVAGTSSGAIVGALVALGSTPDEIATIVRRVRPWQLWRQAFDPGLAEASLMRGRRLEAWLDRELFHGATFADLRLPFAVACTDLVTGDLDLLQEGSLARAMVASSALAGFFAPVVQGDRVWVDGGFVEAVPYRALQALDPPRALGLHAGIDAGRSRVISGVRWVHASAGGRRWREWSLARGVGGPWRRLARGTALAAQSYERGLVVPPGARLVSARPPVAWWDFHRAEEAMKAGSMAIEAAFESGDLAAWLAGDADPRTHAALLSGRTT
jgi:predicted acylesterase/phospholipase RssA